jgi:long-subunit fatty acid transport protein
LLLLALVLPAQAGGYYYSDSGIVATGRGGAWIAGAHGQFAQYHNPAGLIRTKAPTINVGRSGVQQNVRFDRLVPADDTTATATATGADVRFDTVENGARAFDVPQLGFVTPLGDHLALAVGFISPFAPSSLYPEEGPQRYTVKDTGIYQFGIGPSLAWQPLPWLTVGGGVQWSYLSLEQTLDITYSGNDDPSGDIAVAAEVVDPFTLTGNLGLLVEPHEAVSVGLSWTPASSYEARGRGTLDFEGNALAFLLDETFYADDDVALSIDLPHVLRAGVAVRPVPTVEIEGAIVWQGWSSLADIEITEIDVEVESQSVLVPEDQRKVDDRIVLPAGLKDTVSLRLGAEWRVSDGLALRTGGFREGGALTDDEISVALVDPVKWQVGGGASAWTKGERFRLDLAAATLFFPTLELRDSTVKQIDAGVFDDVEPTVVGNGNLSSSGWVVGVQGSWRLGKARP